MSSEKALHATVISHFGNEILICDEDNQRRRATVRQDLPPLVCGDRVSCEVTELDDIVITGLHDRHGTLKRSTPFQESKLIAANVDIALVVCSHKPRLNTGLLDRYLAAAELAEIETHIVFNKVDTLNEKDAENIKQTLSTYEEIGYPVYFISAKLMQGVETLRNILQAKTGVLVGQSGVGKSSIIRALLPDAKPKVAEVSDKTNKGQHTTTTSELYRLDKDSYVIDSPGIREFGLGNVDPEQLIYGFKEFRPLLGQCKFRDCTHTREPGCAILNAVKEGEISQMRYDSYLRILASLSD
jgi:ribosome biogenesis GTPase